MVLWGTVKGKKFSLLLLFSLCGLYFAASSALAQMEFDAGGQTGSIDQETATGDLTFDTNSNERARLHTSGRLELQEGAQVGSDTEETQCASAADAGTLRYTYATNETGLYFHWPFDDTSGSAITESIQSATSTWSDSTGNDVTEEATTGQVGGAIDFDGTNDQIFSPNSAIDTGDLDDLDEATLCIWFYPDTNQTNEVLTRWQNTSGAPFFDIQLESSSGVVEARVRLDNGSNYNATGSDGGAGFYNGGWHLACAVWDRSLSTDRFKIYVDGSQVGADNAADSPIRYDNFNDNAEWFHGRNDFDGRNFDGKLDDVRFYTRALSSSDVSGLYNGGSAVLQYCDGSAWQTLEFE